MNSGSGVLSFANKPPTGCVKDKYLIANYGRTVSLTLPTSSGNYILTSQTDKQFKDEPVIDPSWYNDTVDNTLSVPICYNMKIYPAGSTYNLYCDFSTTTGSYYFYLKLTYWKLS